MPAEMSEKLFDVIGYQFIDQRSLDEALTHSSAVDCVMDNDRLEFLGDRVLGLIIADRLLCDFPEADTGSLARRYNKLVQRDSLVHVAEEIGLGSFLNMSLAEQEAGGRGKPAILADSCEALIAAIYIDGGMQAAIEFVERFWTTMIDDAATSQKDPKTALQEWAHAKLGELPSYRELERKGPPHRPRFTVEVSLTGYLPAMGRGDSKRQAQQSAAAEFLGRVSELKEEKL